MATARKPYRIRLMNVADLAPAPYNPRTISDAALAGLDESIRRWGCLQPLVWNKRTGELVAGHQRLQVLRSQGIGRIEVAVVDLPPDEAKALNVALNNPHIQGDWDWGLLEGLLDEIADVPGLDAAAMGFDGLRADLEAELAKAEREIADGLTDPDRAPEPPSDPVTQRGDLWLLGEHRLLCGDATQPQDVVRLLNGATPFICVTDPPYGVSYDPAWRQRAAEKGHLAYASRRIGKVANDDRADWRAAWELFPGDVLYSWHPPGATSIVHGNAISAAGFALRMQIIWAKPHLVIGRGDYHVQHEPCWYAVRKGKPAHRTNDRTQTTLWHITLDANVPGGHSTQKPVECMARAIGNHEAMGGGCYDPFIGSGTSLIACEQLGRRCFGMEIEPKYCDVAVRRWEEFTGREAQLERPKSTKL